MAATVAIRGEIRTPGAGPRRESEDQPVSVQPLNIEALAPLLARVSEREQRLILTWLARHSVDEAITLALSTVPPPLEELCRAITSPEVALVSPRRLNDAVIDAGSVLKNNSASAGEKQLAELLIQEGNKVLRLNESQLLAAQMEFPDTFSTSGELIMGELRRTILARLAGKTFSLDPAHTPLVAGTILSYGERLAGEALIRGEDGYEGPVSGSPANGLIGTIIRYRAKKELFAEIARSLRARGITGEAIETDTTHIIKVSVAANSPQRMREVLPVRRHEPPRPLSLGPTQGIVMHARQGRMPEYTLYRGNYETNFPQYEDYVFSHLTDRGTAFFTGRGNTVGWFNGSYYKVECGTGNQINRAQLTDGFIAINEEAGTEKRNILYHVREGHGVEQHNLASDYTALPAERSCLVLSNDQLIYFCGGLPRTFHCAATKLEHFRPWKDGFVAIVNKEPNDRTLVYFDGHGEFSSIAQILEPADGWCDSQQFVVSAYGKQHDGTTVWFHTGTNIIKTDIDRHTARPSLIGKNVKISSKNRICWVLTNSGTLEELPSPGIKAASGEPSVFQCMFDRDSSELLLFSDQFIGAKRVPATGRLGIGDAPTYVVTDGTAARIHYFDGIRWFEHQHVCSIATQTLTSSGRILIWDSAAQTALTVDARSGEPISRFDHVLAIRQKNPLGVVVRSGSGGCNLFDLEGREIFGGAEPNAIGMLRDERVVWRREGEKLVMYDLLHPESERAIKPEEVDDSISRKLRLLDALRTNAAPEQRKEALELVRSAPAPMSASGGAALTINELLGSGRKVVTDALSYGTQPTIRELSTLVHSLMFPSLRPDRKPSPPVGPVLGFATVNDGDGADPRDEPAVPLRLNRAVGDYMILGTYGAYRDGKWHLSSVAPDQPSTCETVGGMVTIRPPPTGRTVLAYPWYGSLDSEVEVSGGRRWIFSGASPVQVERSSSGDYSTKTAVGVSKLSYGIRIPTALPQFESLSAADYASFRRDRAAPVREEFGTELGTLPVQLKRLVDEVRGLPPLDQLDKLAHLTQLYGFYDPYHRDVQELFNRLSPTDRLHAMVLRVTELRKSHPKLREALNGKIFSGVCMDFALFGVMAQRRLGLLSGMATTLSMTGRRVDGLHAVAFTPWPERGSGKLLFRANEFTPAHTRLTISPRHYREAKEQSDAREANAIRPERRRSGTAHVPLPKIPELSAPAAPISYSSAIDELVFSLEVVKYGGGTSISRELAEYRAGNRRAERAQLQEMLVRFKEPSESSDALYEKLLNALAPVWNEISIEAREALRAGCRVVCR